jgi:hypothetical protein
VSFLSDLRRVKSFLEEQKRASVRALARELGLEGETLDEVREGLVGVQGVVRRDGSVLVWNGSPSPEVAPPRGGDPTGRNPGDCTPRHLADKMVCPLLPHDRRRRHLAHPDAGLHQPGRLDGPQVEGRRVQPELSLELMQNYIGVSRPEIDARRNAALREAGLE